MLIPSRALLWSALLSVCACSPTYNWREMRPAGTPLLAHMPCKPEAATRPVPLTGTPTELHMHSCETGGLRFAVAWADVGAPDRVPLALAAWQVASLQSLRVSASAADVEARRWTVVVAGVPDAQGLKAQGVDPEGQPVQTRAAYFAKDSVIYQAAVYGAALPDETVETFFAGLRLGAP